MRLAHEQQVQRITSPGPIYARLCFNSCTLKLIVSVMPNISCALCTQGLGALCSATGLP